MLTIPRAMNTMNPKTLIVHLNLEVITVNITQTDNPRDTCPTRGKRFCPTVENIIPPSDDPVVVAPRANPHFFENQWRITPNADPNMKPLASYRYKVISWFRRWNVRTHPTTESLNEEELPVLCTLCSEEYACEKKTTCD